MVVAVTFALHAEFTPWRRLRSFQRFSYERVPAYLTQIGNVRVRVVLTGVGRRATTAAADRVFDDRPDVCISSGLAGGLHEALRVAQIVASRTVSGHDGRSVAIDPRLLALALSAGASSVPLYSSPTIVVSAGEKRRLRVVADAVDMESAVILAESSRLGIPCIAIRAISDPSTVDLPIDLNRTLTEEGRISPVRTIAALVRRPHAVRRLVRLGLDGHRAATALAAFLDSYIEQLGVW
nr:5'-methylthioadenosine/S-adenosylhomocysteine nucleosidase [uncultured bacterium]